MDINGTILGGFPQQDNFQPGVLKMLNTLSQKQYEIIYLTFRSMIIAGVTKEQLSRVIRQLLIIGLVLYNI